MNLILSHDQQWLAQPTCLVAFAEGEGVSVIPPLQAGPGFGLVISKTAQ